PARQACRCTTWPSSCASRATPSSTDAPRRHEGARASESARAVRSPCEPQEWARAAGVGASVGEPQNSSRALASRTTRRAPGNGGRAVVAQALASAESPPLLQGGLRGPQDGPCLRYRVENRPDSCQRARSGKRALLAVGREA